MADVSSDVPVRITRHAPLDSAELGCAGETRGEDRHRWVTHPALGEWL